MQNLLKYSNQANIVKENYRSQDEEYQFGLAEYVNEIEQNDPTFFRFMLGDDNIGDFGSGISEAQEELYIAIKKEYFTFL